MIVVIIPAKVDSARLPGKNMCLLAGRPMLDYSIDQARESRRVDRILVSTDSDAIEAHARALGVDVVRRDASLGGDTPVIDVYRHAVDRLERDLGQPGVVHVVVGLQPDHPDRNVGVDDALERFSGAQADRLLSTEADGTKNGAHYVLSRHFLDSAISRKDLVMVDDCTNIHTLEDLKRAEERIQAGSAKAQ